jgi:hypothetical protein
MHWFEMDAAGPEIARVLGPGGILAVGVIDNRVDSVAGLERARDCSARCVYPDPS